MPSVEAAGLRITWEAAERITSVRVDGARLDPSVLWQPILEQLSSAPHARGLLVECQDPGVWPSFFAREMTAHHLRHRHHLHIAVVGLSRRDRWGAWLYARAYRLKMRTFDDNQAATRWLRKATA